MIKLTEITGKEVLPNKNYPDDGNGDEVNYGFNNAIDAYNDISIDGDVESLAKIIIEYTSKNSLLYDGCNGLSKTILKSMPNWLVIRKG